MKKKNIKKYIYIKTLKNGFIGRFKNVTFEYLALP